MLKYALIFPLALFFGGCGGGGGGSNGAATPAPAGTTPTTVAPSVSTNYTTSQPLADNTSTDSYRILLMGNSHALGVQAILETVVGLGEPGKTVDVQVAPRSVFLIDRVGDGVSEPTLEGQPWTQVILQAQKYSSSGTVTYPTPAAEYWIRGSKEIGATPILFPEHPRRGNTWEGQTLFELHSGIAERENACVAPVGLVWDEVLFRDPTLDLHQPDGNHATLAGSFLSSLVFYQIVTGQPVELLPEIGGVGVGGDSQQMMKEVVSSVLFAYPPCDYEI